MANIFEITDDIRQIAADAIDDLIDQLGKVCRLVYPPTFSSCSCSDTIGSKGPHVWSHGGYGPLGGDTVCALCGGAGQIATESTEEITLLCNWNIRTFEQIRDTNVEVRLRQGGTIVQTKGYLTDLPKVLRADHIIIQVPMEGYIPYRFKMASEPSDTNNIVQNRYFRMLWRRIG